MPASASAACATSTISDSMSLPSCLPNLLCAQPTMHPLMPPSEVRWRTIASRSALLYPPDMGRGRCFAITQDFGILSRRDRPGQEWATPLAAGQRRSGTRLSRAKLVFADHPLLPIHLVFDPIPRCVALSEE